MTSVHTITCVYNACDFTAYVNLCMKRIQIHYRSQLVHETNMTLLLLHEKPYGWVVCVCDYKGRFIHGKQCVMCVRVCAGSRYILHTWWSRVNERKELAIQITASCDGDDIFHICHCHVKIWHSHCHVCLRKGREGSVLFNDTLNTFYLQLYGVRYMVKDHSDSKR